MLELEPVVQLDIPTLMVMGSFVASFCGAILLGAWWVNRSMHALALWGIASLLMAAGILALVLGPALHAPSVFIVADILLALAHGLIWKAARGIDAKPAPIGIAALGTAVLILVGLIPAAGAVVVPLAFAIDAIYLSAAGISLWLGRGEPLPARWPVIVFIFIHAVFMVMGVHSISGELDRVPTLISLFGAIHFESIVFSVGTTVFLLVLIKERSEAASRLAASLDALTGIANRAAFMEAAGRVVERCRYAATPVAVVMFDLDRFKSINDTFGHAVGDAVIRKFSEVCAAALRPTDVFGRIGGEEFAAVLPRSSADVAFARADRIRAAFAEQCRMIDSRLVKATVSCGVSASAHGGLPLSELLEFSDQALYRAKASGRNRVKRAEQGNAVPKLAAVAQVA
ncbi:MAG TPA: GGDEF domain-containing protein [Pseudolabrys sp.]